MGKAFHNLYIGALHRYIAHRYLAHRYLAHRCLAHSYIALVVLCCDEYVHSWGRWVAYPCYDE